MKQNTKGFYERERAKNLSDVEVFVTEGTYKHFHHQIELLIISKGRFRITINDTEKILTRGAVCVADSFDTHSYEILEQGSIGHVVIVPKNNMLSEYTALTKNLVFESNFLTEQAAFGIIEPLVLMLKKNIEDKNRLFNKGIILAVMGVIEKHMPYKEIRDTDKSYLMKDVLEYIHDNFYENLDLKILAEKFGYTPNHFSMIFNKFTDTKLNEYINSVRIEYAASWMLADMSVIDAAMRAGFESLRTFYRVFNDRFGMPPNKYLRQSGKET